MNSYSKTKKLVLTALFLAIAVLSQLLGSYLGGAGSLGQILTGSLVNMCLVLSGCLIGLSSGITLSVLSPCFAFLLGLMKFPFAIPVVIIGNLIYTIIVTLSFKASLKNKNVIKYVICISSVVIGALLKALAMWSSAKYGLNLFTTVPAPLIASFAFPQVITGSIGGIIAMIIIPILNKSKNS